MKTFSENQRMVTKLLIENNGGMKRNELERISGLAKSSLALTLKQLERKNVLVVKKHNVTHYVELTGWFKGL